MLARETQEEVNFQFSIAHFDRLIFLPQIPFYTLKKIGG